MLSSENPVVSPRAAAGGGPAARLTAKAVAASRATVVVAMPSLARNDPRLPPPLTGSTAIIVSYYSRDSGRYMVPPTPVHGLSVLPRRVRSIRTQRGLDAANQGRTASECQSAWHPHFCFRVKATAAGLSGKGPRATSPEPRRGRSGRGPTTPARLDRSGRRRQRGTARVRAGEGIAAFGSHELRQRPASRGGAGSARRSSSRYRSSSFIGGQSEEFLTHQGIRRLTRHSHFRAMPPPPARYCVGDVAGERRGVQAGRGGLER